MHGAFQRIFSAALDWGDAQATSQGWLADPSGGLGQYGFERQAAPAPAGGVRDLDSVQWTGRDAIALFSKWGVSCDSYRELASFNDAITEFRKMQQQELAEAAYRHAADAQEPVIMLSSRAANLAQRLLVCAGFLLTPPAAEDVRGGGGVAPAPDSAEHFNLVLQREEGGEAASDQAQGGVPLDYDDGSAAGARAAPRFRLCLWCHSPMLAFRDVEALARCVILTSGTLAPLDSFAGELGVAFPLQLQAPHVINVGRQLWAGVVSEAHWAQGVQLISRLGASSLATATAGYSLAAAAAPPPSAGPILGASFPWVVEPLRTHSSIALNGSYRTSQGADYLEGIGTALLSIAASTPGGVLVFFPSYG